MIRDAVCACITVPGRSAWPGQRRHSSAGQKWRHVTPTPGHGGSAQAGSTKALTIRNATTGLRTWRAAGPEQDHREFRPRGALRDWPVHSDRDRRAVWPRAGFLRFIASPVRCQPGPASAGSGQAHRRWPEFSAVPATSAPTVKPTSRRASRQQHHRSAAFQHYASTNPGHVQATYGWKRHGQRVGSQHSGSRSHAVRPSANWKAAGELVASANRILQRWSR
jgi:hypothetical protein